MIETRGLSKTYGPTVALDGVNLSVQPGAIYGLVGPNGAGKTTLLGLLAGLRRPSTGEMSISASPAEVAVLPDTPRYDEWLTGREVVELALRLSRGAVDADRVQSVLNDAGLGDAADRVVGGYSRGMLQRLGIATTVVGNPKLMLLDEPASALDPFGRREVLDLIGRLRGSTTVLFSSHILSDVQEVCDTVGVLDEGRLRFEGPLDELLVGSAIPRYLIRCRPPLDPIEAALLEITWVVAVDRLGPDELAITVSSIEEVEAGLAAALASVDARMISVSAEAVSLERAFLELTR